MSKFARKLRRQSAKPLRPQGADRKMFDAMGELFRHAGESLGFTPEETLEIECMKPCEVKDMLTARALELLELGVESEEEVLGVEAARAELEQRNGPGFVARVAAMGWAAALSVVVFLLPAPAHAHQEVAGFETVSYANSRRRRLRRLLAWFVTNSPARRPGKYRRRAGKCRFGGFTGPMLSNRRFDSFAPRSTSRRFSVTGCALERVSSRPRAERSKSSCVGAGCAFALASCQRKTRTLRSSMPTEVSSALAGARPEKTTRGLGRAVAPPLLPAGPSGCF